MSATSKAAVIAEDDTTDPVHVETASTTALGDKASGAAANQGTADRVAILVLGMHRSGTSALTRLLSLAGAGLPRELIEARESNRLGHWESRPIALHNDALLRRLGTAWSDWQPLDWSALSESEAAEVQDDVATLVADQFGDADMIVIKDPRICRLVPLYDAALYGAGYRVVSVLPYRNPVEVIDSLMARSNWPVHAGRVDAALLWLTHVLEAEHASRGLPRVFVDFNDLLSAWAPLIARLEVVGDLRFTVPRTQLAEEASAFLDRSERHQRRTTAALTREQVTNGWIRQAHAVLAQLRDDPGSAAAMARLDALRAALAGAMPMLRSLAEAGRATGVDLDRARAEAEQFRAAEEVLRADLAALRADRQGERQETEALRQDNAALRHDARILQARAAKLAIELDSRSRRIDALAAEAQAAEQVAAARKVEIAASQARVAELATELDSRSRRIDALAAEAEVATADLRTQMDAHTQTIEVMEAEAQAAREVHEAELRALHDAYRGSRSWRVTAPLRAVRTITVALSQHTASARELVARRGGWRASARTALAILKHEGVRGLRLRLEAHQVAARSDMRVSHVEQPNSDYVNDLAAGRSDVLLSDWHVRLIRALHDDSPPAADGPTVGLSLVTYNSARWLPDFFSGLLAQSFPLSRLNVVVVDHGSTDDTRAALEAHRRAYGNRYASFTILERPNRGFGAGHDHAIRHLADSFVLVSNVDLEFHKDSIAHALRAALADRDDVASWELRQCPYEHPKYYDPVTLEAVWSSHACILIRRAAYLQVGGYDDRIFMYGEDVELSYRFRGAGWRLRYLPQVPVTHHVDLADPTMRPLQLSGSVAANVLLRHRFGGQHLGAEGEALLAQVCQTERDPRRRRALTEAQKVIARDRAHFQQNLHPSAQVPFPFSGFDYVMARDGADVSLQSAAPLRTRQRVSIVTRTHGPKVAILREAIASVLNQTYRDIEHIIVEDRTDFAAGLVAEVAAAYGTNIRYLKSDGAGRSAAGNFGLANAKGELLMFLDNDDLLFPDHTEILARAVDSRPQHVGAYSLAWDTHTRYDEQGRYHEVLHVLPAVHRLDFDRERLTKMNFIPIQAMMFHRSLFEREGGFHDEIDHLEDWNLWSRYARHGDFTRVGKVTSLYRTPADPEVRARRQAELDGAYDRVKSLNTKITASNLGAASG